MQDPRTVDERGTPERPKAAGLGFPAWFLLSLGVLLLWIYAYRMTSNPLKWEEPRRCLVAMEMIHSGDYVVPHLLQEPYRKKPPLQNWLIVLLSGNDPARVGKLVVRGLSLLAVIGTCLLLWRLGIGRTGPPHLLPVLVFLTMGTVLQAGRTGEIDPLFCFFTTAALACVELGRRRGSAFVQWSLPQVFVALGVLTKIIAPLFFYPPVLFWAWRRRREVRFSLPAFAFGLVLMGLVVAAWMVPYSVLSPAGDLSRRWVLEILTRTAHKEGAEIAEHVVTYPLLFLGWLTPWSIYLVVLAIRARRSVLDLLRRDPFLYLCAAVVVWGAIAFFFVPEQKARYLLPVFPFASALVASFAARGLPVFAQAGESRRGPGRRWWFWVALAAVWTTAVFIAGPRMLQDLRMVVPPLLAGLFTLALFGRWFVAGRPGFRAASVLVLGLVYCVVYAGLSEVREARRSAVWEESGRALARAIDDERPVVSHRGVRLSVAYEMTHLLGRPLSRFPDSPGPSWWVAGPTYGGPPPQEPRATAPPYDLWRLEQPETWSLLSKPLFPPPLEDEVRIDRLEKLASARRARAALPDDADATIWVGRRLAYLGRYREAVAVYDDGIERHPEDPRMYRHRGHRFITLRRFERAIDDLERAARLVAGRPDVVEPDGLPNARNIPTSTLQSNIWYHLGLAYYLRGDMENAARCYRECMKFSENPDMLCATTHWLYMTLRRMGREAEAQQLLEPIHADMEILENHAYHSLLLMYKGRRTPDQLLAADGEAAAAYGVANWHLYNGRRQEAIDVLVAILSGKQWAAFGFIAAEADTDRVWRRAL